MTSSTRCVREVGQRACVKRDCCLGAHGRAGEVSPAECAEVDERCGRRLIGEEQPALVAQQLRGLGEVGCAVLCL